MGHEVRLDTVISETHIFTCDICGLPTSERNTCQLCSRYLCPSHICEFYGADSESIGLPYCSSCWGAGEKAREEIVLAEKNCDSTVDMLLCEWKRNAGRRLKAEREKLLKGVVK